MIYLVDLRNIIMFMSYHKKGKDSRIINKTFYQGTVHSRFNLVSTVLILNSEAQAQDVSICLESIQFNRV
jgi:hypothetical protein